ncbi:MAG: hypothetical protein RLY31_715 [Bacteroidota bacterium]|jgi:outer membrane protein
MKNISLVINVLLLVAVAFLYVDRFGGGSVAPAGDTGDAASADAGARLRVVHLNLDSLHEKSAEFQNMKASLEQQQLAAENALTKRAQAFEQEVMAYQQKVSSGTMTPKSAEEEQTRLARKEQTIMAERERLTNELLKATDDFNSQFTSKVKEYLDSLKAQRNYDYILVTGTGSPVLLSNEQLDITDEVLRLLNQQGQ